MHLLKIYKNYTLFIYYILKFGITGTIILKIKAKSRNNVDRQI